MIWSINGMRYGSSSEYYSMHSIEISLPFIPSSVSIFKDAFIATEKEKKPKWLPINLLAHLKSTWSNGKWKADQVITNGKSKDFIAWSKTLITTDSILVRWDNFVAYLLTTDISPSNSQWMKMSTKYVGIMILYSLLIPKSGRCMVWH